MAKKQSKVKTDKTRQLELSLDRDLFLRQLLRELTGTLEEIVGLDETSGFVSIVGQRIGEWINQDYCQALDTRQLSRSQVSHVLVDFKRRIQGDFYLISEDKEKIVVGSRACPFGDKVKDRQSLCMMTSNVFGTIAAENLGYAKVSLQKTIANGDPGCEVVVYIKNTAEAEGEQGNEYYGS